MFRPLLWMIGLIAVLGSLGCPAAPPSKASLVLVSTTSTQDSGLLDHLLPALEQHAGMKVKVIAVGSGQALEMARRGDADLLLTHSPAAEAKFMEEGWGQSRRAVMHNDFVIVGPQTDPASIRSAQSAREALQKIATAHSPFVSRSDQSGTHHKELALWKTAEITPSGTWYIQAGTGMGPCLRMAYEKQAYNLCDRGTYLSLRSNLDLVVLYEGDEQLLNRYSVITINPAKHPQIQQAAAQKLADFLVSPEGQTQIGLFGVDRFGEPLFIPDAK